MTTLVLIVVLWLVPMYVCYEQGKPKRRQGIGWGVCLGWIGVLALAALPAAPERVIPDTTTDEWKRKARREGTMITVGVVAAVVVLVIVAGLAG